MVDTRDLKSLGPQRPCGFKSHPGHNMVPGLILPAHPRSRIAPTPSGLLHIGNAASFVLTERLVRQAEGTLLLRIDDLDADRVRPAYITDIFDTLAWLGIVPDQGPVDASTLADNWSQRSRVHLYDAALDRLRALGLVYGCNCSRRQVMDRSEDGLYPGTCRDKGLDLDAPDTAWRLRLPEACSVHVSGPGADVPVDLSRDMGDPVVRTRRGVAAYQIASLVDDVTFGIDLIVRGEDLLPSSALQLHLAAVLGEEGFRKATFIHHPLLTDAVGSKLSKSQGAGSLKEMRKNGADREIVLRLADDLLAATLSHKAGPRTFDPGSPIPPGGAGSSHR